MLRALLCTRWWIHCALCAFENITHCHSHHPLPPPTCKLNPGGEFPILHSTGHPDFMVRTTLAIFDAASENRGMKLASGGVLADYLDRAPLQVNFIPFFSQHGMTKFSHK